MTGFVTDRLHRAILGLRISRPGNSQGDVADGLPNDTEGKNQRRGRLAGGDTLANLSHQGSGQLLAPVPSAGGSDVMTVLLGADPLEVGKSIVVYVKVQMVALFIRPRRANVRRKNEPVNSKHPASLIFPEVHCPIAAANVAGTENLPAIEPRGAAGTVSKSVKRANSALVGSLVETFVTGDGLPNLDGSVYRSHWTSSAGLWLGPLWRSLRRCGPFCFAPILPPRAAA